MQHPCTSMEEPFMEPKWIQKTMNSLSTAKEKTTHQSSVMSHYQEQQLDFTAECQVWRKKQEGEVRATKNFHFYFCGPPCWTKEAAKALVKRAAYRHYCPCPHTRLEESCQGWLTISVRLCSSFCPRENQKVSNVSPTSPGSHIKATRISWISGMRTRKCGHSWIRC